jgi:hypothetical protein
MSPRYAKRQERARPDFGPESFPIAPDEFAATAKRIRRCVKLPPGVRVCWSLAKCADGNAGECVQTPRGNYRIRIDPVLPRGYAIYLMLHEMAHVMQWVEFPDEGEDHGPGFGQCWARVYKAYFRCD